MSTPTPASSAATPWLETPTPVLPAVWNLDDDWLECVAVHDETPDVRTFTLRAVAPRVFAHRPGQYLTLTLPLPGQVLYRCYTISSPPTRPDRVTITVKRTGGPGSGWLHDHLRPGGRIAALGPSGEFSPWSGPIAEGSPDVPVLMLSGGSGITPLLAMLRTLADLGEDRDVVFVHAARTPEDLIARHELAVLARRMPRLSLALVCETRGRDAAWSGWLGRIHAGLLRAVAPDLAARAVWCCGPAPFMAAMRALLAAEGHDPLRYREESFSLEALPSSAGAGPILPDASKGDAQATGPVVADPISGTGGGGAILPTPVPGAAVNGVEAVEAAGALAAVVSLQPPSDEPIYTIRLQRSEEDFPCPESMTILQAARAAGVRIPTSCQNGVCSTCRTMKLTGEVAMNQNGGLRPREERQGWILPCCSQPRSDLLLDR